MMYFIMSTNTYASKNAPMHNINIGAATPSNTTSTGIAIIASVNKIIVRNIIMNTSNVIVS